MQEGISTMANNITEYNATPGSNTTIDSISIDEGMAASNVNNAIRSLMSHLKNVDTGSQALTALSVTGDLTVDTSTLKVDSANNRVGVGTASPASELTVAHASGTDGRGIRLVNSSDSQTYETRIGVQGLENTSYAIKDITQDAVRLLIDLNGHVTMPSQTAFSVQKSSSGQTNVSTNTTVTFDSEIFDRNGDFASNTFALAVTRVYQLNFIVRVDELDTDANWTRFQLVTSNRTYEPNIVDPGAFSGDPNYWNFTIAVLADMDANDTVTVNFQQDGGAAQVDIGTVFFSGYLVA